MGLLIYWLLGCLIDWLHDWFSCELGGWFVVGRLICKLVGKLFGYLVCW